MVEFDISLAFLATASPLFSLSKKNPHCFMLSGACIGMRALYSSMAGQPRSATDVSIRGNMEYITAGGINCQIYLYKNKALSFVYRLILCSAVHKK